MRRIALVLVAVACGASDVASAASPHVTVVPKPAFPARLAQLMPSGELRLERLSSSPRQPTYAAELELFDLPEKALALFGGLEARPRAIPQPGVTIVVYGAGFVAAFGPRGGMKYAFDLRSFGFPPTSLVPRAYGPQEITWARQLGRVLVVQTNHLGYATDSGGRNGYLTGIDLDTGKVRWRSPALVANAQNFVVVKGLIVSGYGFTAEKDWLYVVDPATGRVRDRLALPSMAERISVRGERIVVRCYDARVVVRLA